MNMVLLPPGNLHWRSRTVNDSNGMSQVPHRSARAWMGPTARRGLFSLCSAFFHGQTRVPVGESYERNYHHRIMEYPELKGIRIIRSNSQWIHLRTENCVEDSRISSLLRPQRRSYFLVNLLLRTGRVSTHNFLPVSTIQSFFSLWVKDFKYFDFVFFILPLLHSKFFQDLLVPCGDSGKWYRESLEGSQPERRSCTAHPKQQCTAFL